MKGLSTTTVLTQLFLCACLPAEAGIHKGDKAPLFQSVDENMNPVDMRELIRGKPLVVVVGSAS